MNGYFPYIAFVAYLLFAGGLLFISNMLKPKKKSNPLFLLSVILIGFVCGVIMLITMIALS